MISVIASTTSAFDPRVELYRSTALAAGADVSVLGLDYRNGVADLLFRSEGAPAYPNEPSQSFDHVSEIVADYLRVTQPKTLVLHEPDALRATIRSKAELPANVIYDAHEFYYDQRGISNLRRAWLFFTHNTAARRINTVVTVSEGVRNLYKKTVEFRAKDIEVIRNIAPPPVDIEPKDLHSLTNSDSDAVFVVFHGALWSGRGIEDVAKAVEQLGDPFRFLCIGHGPLNEALSAFKNTHVLPRIPMKEVHSYLLGADLGVIPYPPTNLNHIHAEPNKLWDFAYASLPIVARRLPGVARAAGDHLHWVGAEAGPNEIAAAIQGAFEHRDVLRQKTQALDPAAAFKAEQLKLKSLLAP